MNNRGPNASDSLVYDSRVLLFSTVLWQQGTELCRQPVIGNRYVLLFNGDLYNKRDETKCSDTSWLYEQISATDDISQVFKILKGPFSIILLDKTLQRIYFARDSLGRNSLLLGRSQAGIVVSSVLGITKCRAIFHINIIIAFKQKVIHCSIQLRFNQTEHILLT